MRRLALGWSFGLAAAAAVALGAAEPAATAEPIEYSAVNGSRTYKTYCAACHGVAGEGDGYIAETLKKSPTDLTRLAETNGGEFPAARARAVIDGQQEVKTHGQREMPVWGDVFLWPEGDTPERRVQVDRKVGELVAYLKSLQQPAETEN